MVLKLTATAWSLVTNGYLLAIMALLATAIYGLSTQSRILFKYRSVVVLAAIMCVIDALSYGQLFSTFLSASTGNNLSIGSGHSSFSNTTRYAAWIITVPLQIVILVGVLGLKGKISAALKSRLIPAIVIMMSLGYIGEASDPLKITVGILSTLLFLYIIYLLIKPFESLLIEQSPDVQIQFRRLRLIIISLWCTYPLFYYLASESALAASENYSFIAQQTLFVVVDLLSKCYFSIQIFKIAHLKSVEDGMPHHG
ncbi:unannotated protein [freshwater metagenome]|uniref:Unannotated protein n=1 Tax=freshwater metagenome TaxID=449393 RepID=A0A6J7HWI7_9ZZZZ